VKKPFDIASFVPQEDLESPSVRAAFLLLQSICSVSAKWKPLNAADQRISVPSALSSVRMAFLLAQASDRGRIHSLRLWLELSCLSLDASRNQPPPHQRNPLPVIFPRLLVLLSFSDPDCFCFKRFFQGLHMEAQSLRQASRVPKKPPTRSPSLYFCFRCPPSFRPTTTLPPKVPVGVPLPRASTLEVGEVFSLRDVEALGV